MKKRKSDIFTSMFAQKPRTSSFDLSHDKKLSLKMGHLVPVLCMDVLPGDKLHIKSENMLRLAPLVSPVMHRIDINVHTFFVPNRILWSDWEDFITGAEDVEHPYFDGYNVTGSYTDGCVGDYLGIAPSPDTVFDQKINALPVAAYYKIFDEYYRDQNLEPVEKFTPLVAGDNPVYRVLAVADPRRRAWQHDYFTSCLPFAQKGDEVTLPLLQGGAVDVKFNPTEVPEGFPAFIDSVTGGDAPVGGSPVVQDNSSTIRKSGSPNPLAYDPRGTLEVDINGEASSINTLRRSFKLQEWLEKNARAGTRYVESLLVHFGVRSSDARVNRPEYIGGQKQVMTISEVLSTAQTVDQDSNDVPVGNMAGHGISVGGGKSSYYTAEEHGWIISIMSVRPQTAYHQGLARMFQRKDKFDYAFPTFANIGEQEVKVSEVRNDIGTLEQLDETFGYIPRYSEYKYIPSGVHGEMRNSLNFWHLGRTFTGNTLPQLNEEFIHCKPSTRIFAVEDEEVDNIYAHVFNTVHAVRPLPRFGVPTL